MNKKYEKWCYGGVSKAFFIQQSEVIHQYNTKMMDRLLLIMTIIIGAYLVASRGGGIFSKYFVAYVVCFAALLSMLCIFKLKANKSIAFIKVYILLFSCVMFSFVCITGTVFDTDSRASLFIVYVLVLPMLFVIPTHHTYTFLTIATCIFSYMSLLLKESHNSQMDVAHGFTCLVIGIFLSHHILKSRIALYAVNVQLDARNLQLDKQLQEQEIQLLQGRISIMLSQIQPHFIYNTLTAICGLCDKNLKEAKRVTAKFSDYRRHNLDSLNQSDPIPFEHELLHTQTYLEIEQTRLGERLSIVYDIEATDFKLPSLTMQPIVENAVKHGATKRKGGGTVTISTREREDCYEIIIADDGVGFDTEKPQEAPETHIGIENVRTRLWSIIHGTLTITSEVGSGTIATIRIPTMSERLKKGSRLYRARKSNFKMTQSAQELDFYKAISPASSQFATSNRMSPQGISYTYLATDPETCYSECRMCIGEYAIVGAFETKMTLNILNLSSKKYVFIENSMFVQAATSLRT